MIADRIASLIWKINSLLWECRLGISTSGRYGDGDATSGEHIYYVTTPYVSIFQILGSLSLTPADVFVDLGSGKGRVVCCAATYDIDRAIGVEDVESLYELGKHNAQRLRGRRAPVIFIRGKAEKFDYTQGTVFYLFNPFGPETMKEMLRRLEYGLFTKPRAVRIVYVNPLWEEPLTNSGWLTRCAVWQPSGLKWPVSIWTTRYSHSQ
jgi:Histone methylation protein DOT1